MRMSTIENRICKRFFLIHLNILYLFIKNSLFWNINMNIDNTIYYLYKIRTKAA